jgi:hypothetical protein
MLKGKGNFSSNDDDGLKNVHNSDLIRREIILNWTSNYFKTVIIISINNYEIK